MQILGDIAGNLDAKKACKEALKIHEKFLKKVSFYHSFKLVEDKSFIY